MTIEELEIIVTANVEKAIQELKRLKPEIEKATGQVQDKMKDVKITGFKDMGDDVKKYTGDLSKAMEKVDFSKVTKGASGATEAVGEVGKAMGSTEATAGAVGGKFAEIGGKLAPILGKLAPILATVASILSVVAVVFVVIKLIIGAVKLGIKIANGLKEAVKSVASILYKVATFNIGKLFGADMKSGLKSLLQYASTLFSLRSIYSLLQSSANAWLNSTDAGAQQLRANIDYMKNAIGSSLAPILEYLVNLAYQLLRAIQTILYTLTGVNIFARATAKSMSATAGGAGKASKEMQKLAGIHDEINNIADNDSGGGGRRRSEAE